MSSEVVVLIVSCVALVILGLVLCDRVLRAVGDNKLSLCTVEVRAKLPKIIAVRIKIESRRGPDELPPGDAAGPSS